MKKLLVSLCIVCIIFNQGIAAYAFSEHEPNNTFKEVKHCGYTFGNSTKVIYVYGLVTPEDKVDWIRIGTKSSYHKYGNCEISLRIIDNYDIDLYMYDENEKLITSSTNAINEDEEINGYFMQPDKHYYFKIVHHTGGMPKEPNYQFKVKLLD